MSYTPGPLPKETPPFLVRELHAIGEGLEQPRQVVAFAPTAVEPAKPRDGMMVKAISPWDPGYGFGPYIYDSTQGWIPMFGAAVGEGAIVACSGEAADLAVGLVRTFRLPYPVEIDEVMADFVTAPTGQNAIIDIKVSGTSILSTKITVEAGEETSLTATTQPVISSAAHEKGDKVTIHVDQIGSSVAGAGLKVGFVWRRVT